MSVLIGLTGPTGAGKSRASLRAAECGIKVVDCDLLARRAVLPGSEGLSAVTDAFGSGILNLDGTLNRRTLAAVAFSSPEKTELLNRTLLPHITRLVRAEITGGCVLLDAPTLFESGLDAICSVTVAVLADRETRLSRIIARDGLTLNEAQTRVSAGKDDAFYRARADHIVYNNGDDAVFDREMSALFNNIIGG